MFHKTGKAKVFFGLGLGLMVLSIVLALVFSCTGGGGGVVIEPQRPTKIVKICPDSGLLAGEYCPQAVDRKFYSEPRAGEPVAPTETCSLHMKPVPTPAPPFIGCSVYQLIGFPREQITEFLEKLAAAGGNATEAFFIFSWAVDDPSAGWRWSPCKQVGWYTDDAVPGRQLPLFDLAQRNEDVLTKWAFVAAECKRMGIALFLRFEDFCSIKTPLNKRHYLFRANTWRMNDPGTYNWPAGTQDGFENSGYMKSVRSILGWIVEILKTSGVTFYIVPQNESDMLRNSEETEAQADQTVVAYHHWFFKYAADLGVPAGHVVINTSQALAQLRAEHPEAPIEIHGCNSPDRMEEYNAKFGDPAKISFNGDGPDPYAAGAAGDKLDKRQPSIEQGKYMGDRARAWGAFAVLFFARESESASPYDIGRVVEAFAVVRAIAGK